MFKHTLFLLTFFASFISINAQTNIEQSTYYQFELTDSSKFIGSIVFEDKSVIQIKQISGDEIRINQSDILFKNIVTLDFVNNLSLDSTETAEITSKILDRDSLKVFRFQLIGGSTLIGRIISEDSTTVTINLLSDVETTIQKKIIVRKESVSTKIKNGQFWFDDPNSTRLFFAPTGRRLKSGSGYFSVYELFFPMFAVGISDYVTLASGISFIPGSDNQIFYFAPKITPFQNDKFAISIGDFFVSFPNNRDNLNILYTVGTASFNTSAITIGVGYETTSDKPILFIGGEVRVARYAKLITENWFIADSEYGFLSIGFRFLGERIAVDFALVSPLTERADPVYFPWIGFAYNF